MRMRAARFALLTAAALFASACSAQQAGVGDKSGGSAGPVILRLATPDGGGKVGLDIANRFAAAVRRASNGRVIVKVTTGFGGTTQWDQATIRALREGTFDLALIPARAWHSEGVTTLEALQLPNLIETDEQAQRVATSAVVPDLLAGLDAVGATGLGLYPEGLRHFAIWGEQHPLTPDSLKGLVVSSALADTPYATIQALGGTPVEGGSDIHEEVAAGEVRAAETTLWLLGTLPQVPTKPVMTANVSLYYKFQILAAQSPAWQAMDANTQDVIKTAAAEAHEAGVTEVGGEQAGREFACESGQIVMNAPAADVARLRTALSWTLDTAVSDPTTGRLVDAVRTAAGPRRPLPLKPCHPAGVIDPAGVRPVPGDLPDGVYRIEVTDAMLERAGLRRSADRDNNHGIYTFTLRGGHYAWTQRADNALFGATEGSGVYEVHGHTVTWLWGPESDGYALKMFWSVRGDGALVMRAAPNLPPGDISPMRLGPMTRIE